MSADPTLTYAILLRLSRFYSDTEAQAWMSLPHPQLGGKTALQEIADGGVKNVEAIIERLECSAYL
jgi:uncharacterized protein (DUF2384 family)